MGINYYNFLIFSFSYFVVRKHFLKIGNLNLKLISYICTYMRLYIEFDLIFNINSNLAQRIL